MKANRISIPSSAGLIMPGDLGSNNQPGEIYLANEARFTSSNFSQPLTAYSVGWKDAEDIKATLDFIAPEVPVGRRFEFKNATNSEEFLSEADDVRAIGSAFKRVEFRGSTTNEKTINKGLTSLGAMMKHHASAPTRISSGTRAMLLNNGGSR